MTIRSRRRTPSRTDRTRQILWCAFAIGVLNAARGAWLQVTMGTELESILLLSLANAVATGSLFALLAVVIASRPSSQRGR